MYDLDFIRSHPGRVVLGDLVDLLPGYSERGRVGIPAALRIVMGRDIGADRSIRWALLGGCERTPASERALLRAGDLLLTTRTADPQVIAIAAPPTDAVAGAPFAILRRKQGAESLVDVEYLSWVLGTEGARERLRQLVRGSSMPFLAVADLALFEVALPPIDRQRLIVRSHELRRRATELTQRFDRLIEQLLASAIHCPTGGDPTGGRPAS